MARYIADIGEYERGCTVSFKAPNDEIAIQRGWALANQYKQGEICEGTPCLVQMDKVCAGGERRYVGCYMDPKFWFHA